MNRLPLVAIVLGTALAACGLPEESTPERLVLTDAQARPLTERAFEATPARLERGAYLVEAVLWCFLCHSERNWDAPGAPPVEGMAGAGQVYSQSGDRRLVAPNLTPDDATGIGTWSDDMLVRAIREGVGHDGRVLHPAMQYQSMRSLSDEDVAAIVVFLRSRPPVRNPLPPTRLPMDEQERLAARLRPLHGPVAERDFSDPVERGRYLVQVSDCAGCHTAWEAARNPGLLGGGNVIDRGEREAFSTNITPHPSGLGYDADTFTGVIRTGKNGTLSGLMPWAAFRHMTDADLAAVHAFLQTMQPVAHFVTNLGEPTPCVVCGQTHGLGAQNAIVRPEAAAVDPALFADYVGTYRADDYGFTLRVTQSGDTLRAQEEDGPVAELIPQSEARFFMLGGLAALRFERDDVGRVAAVVSEEVEELRFSRIE